MENEHREKLAKQVMQAKDGDREKLAKQVIQTSDSLNKAIHAAGGVPFDYNSMVSMTLFEFIWRTAAPNGIRFHFQSPMVALDDDDDEEERLSKKE
jgi:hypothetical protein